MNIKPCLKACLEHFGYSIRRIPPSQKTVRGVDWLSDLRRLTKDKNIDTIFDVGANTGQTALELTRTFPKATIHSFEPFPGSFAQLQKNLKNRLSVKSHNLALAEKSGQMQFFVNANSETNSLLKTSLEAANFEQGSLMAHSTSIDVKVETLDGFCEREHITNIDILKLDTQGYELKVLAGAHSGLAHHKIKMVCAEVLFSSLYENQAYFHEVYQYLHSSGYSFLGLYGHSYSSANRLLWADALFIADELVE
jgi:FkbM family methyltransferase